MTKILQILGAISLLLVYTSSLGAAKLSKEAEAGIGVGVGAYLLLVAMQLYVGIKYRNELTTAVNSKVQRAKISLKLKQATSNGEGSKVMREYNEATSDAWVAVKHDATQLKWGNIRLNPLMKHETLYQSMKKMVDSKKTPDDYFKGLNEKDKSSLQNNLKKYKDGVATMKETSTKISATKKNAKPVGSQAHEISDTVPEVHDVKVNSDPVKPLP
jgi:hypothetical protein